MTIESINDGKDYVENYDWYDSMGLPRKIKWYKKTDDRYSNVENMKSYMESWLEIYSHPVIGYELSISMFELTPELGDYVYIYDKELRIRGWLRIVSRKRNILQPYLSTVQLESTKKTIVETIVSNTVTSTKVEEVIQSGGTVGGSSQLPTGTENWIMQYKDGRWIASNALEEIDARIQALEQGGGGGSVLV